MKKITLAHGNGGVETNEFIQKVFKKYLGDFLCADGEDAGIFINNAKSYCMSTDSYVISPIFFPGGDIGKLSICGSSNDVAMMGAKPKYISIGFIIEEGFEIIELEKILVSIKKELEQTSLQIISADTKVVPKGNVDKIFINTTAIGEIVKEGISAKNLKEGDCIVLSGDIGRHGSMIFCARSEIDLHSNLQSDCKQLYPMLDKIFQSDISINALRDATRGGLAAVMNEWANASKVNIILEEKSIPISKEVKGVCEILGLEPYVLANEGVCVFSATASDAIKICDILNSSSKGKEATIIGRVEGNNIATPKVILKNDWGTKRYLEYPQGEILPRIC
ncbi:hydrogenase expression/formation protein HypE [Helicobacter cappadocius]|uniref:Hydrogenase expression/formation protein HypE n=1 Tax=Helicobacter cappadocius TaxID=3063998 RepID=A0AA90PKM7_9HELI|nr:MULTISPECIES: hydrogenase expression/formation protein HypE [unclassified Helicobacter]MDO7253812.1 hydrogenase expression/formation protein HypE [Helicobacter sp. faydin-H75]MDP2539701.1 hydrogenase expression/formation protein HypE [Helicobacter sp. faydin-H76]